MHLRNYIEINGNAKIAKLLGTSRSSVSHWYARNCLPSHRQLLMIHTKTKGKVCIIETIKDFFKKKKVKPKKKSCRK